MNKPSNVKARSNWRLWIRYQDGKEGEVDLSDLAGRGVFSQWEDQNFFKRVHIAEDGAIHWNEDLELCPDALYLKLTGQKPEQAFPQLDTKTHA